MKPRDFEGFWDYDCLPEKNKIVSVSFQEAALKEGKGQPFIILKKFNKIGEWKEKKPLPYSNHT